MPMSAPNFTWEYDGVELAGSWWWLYMMGLSFFDIVTRHFRYFASARFHVSFVQRSVMRRRSWRYTFAIAFSLINYLCLTFPIALISTITYARQSELCYLQRTRSIVCDLQI